jgi:hypothetical protein
LVWQIFSTLYYLSNLYGIWRTESGGEFFNFEVSIRAIDFFIESYFWLCTFSLYKVLKYNEGLEGSRLNLLGAHQISHGTSTPSTIPILIVHPPTEGDNELPSVPIPRVKVESSYNPNYLRISTGSPEELRIVEVPRVRCNSSRF